MIINIIGKNLYEAYKKRIPVTMLHVDELISLRVSDFYSDSSSFFPDCSLRPQDFYTADGMFYFLAGESKTPTLVITREAHNPVLLNIDDAFKQLTTGNSNYHPRPKDVNKALAAPDTVLIPLPTLRLTKGDSDCSSLVIGTTPVKYNKLND